MAITTVVQQTAGATGATTTTNFPAMTAAVNDFIVVVVHTDNQTSGTPQTSTITDGHNTWTRQGSSQSVAAGHAQRTEVWTALNNFAGALTINIANSGTTNDFCGVASIYRGVDPTTPILDALTFVTNYTATNAATSFVQTVSKTGALIIGTTTGSSGVVSSASGFGFVDFKSVSSGAGAVNSNAAMIDKIGTVGSQTYNWGSNNWACLAGLTLNPFTVSQSGTITTTLTKVSQSLVAKQNFIGTISTKLTKPSQSLVGRDSARGAITTALTKPSMSAAAKETFTGTIATNLQKVSQALSSKEIVTGAVTTALTNASQLAAGNVVGVVGVITTRLTKANLSIVASQSIKGTINTALSKISQAALAPSNVNGTIATVLHSINISAAAREIITGTAVTTLPNGIAIHATAQEIVEGHATTTLQPFAQTLQAQEIEVGQIVTKLGGASGQMVGVAAEGLEIIEGPIVMNLRPFRSVALAAQLGPPGSGKWYSWRYADR